MGLDRTAALIDLTAGQYQTILDLLERHLPGTEVWAYGSRVKWTSRPQSDLDLVAFATQEQRRQIGNLREAFEESNLPFRVDLFVWDSVPEEFRTEIREEHVGLTKPPRNDIIPLGWRSTTLGSCAVLNDSTYSRREEWPSIRYLDTGSIVENRISSFWDLVLGKDKIPSRARRKLRPGDIVYSTVRPDQLHYGRILDPPENLLVSTGFAVLRGLSQVADTGFLYWFLAQKKITDQLQAIAETSTSAYPSIRPDDIAELEVFLPPLCEQRAIAHVLGTLDDKIELNRRMSETLEQVARALFKSWFVDFDPVRAKMEGRDTGLPRDIADLFPDRMVDSEMGEVPDGWEARSLSSFGDIVTGKTPRTQNRDFYGTDVPFLKIPDMRGKIFVIKTTTMLSRYGAESQSSKTLPPGSISVSCIATYGLLAELTRHCNAGMRNNGE